MTDYNYTDYTINGEIARRLSNSIISSYRSIIHDSFIRTRVPRGPLRPILFLSVSSCLALVGQPLAVYSCANPLCQRGRSPSTYPGITVIASRSLFHRASRIGVILASSAG